MFLRLGRYGAIRWKRWRPQILLQERFEPHVKWGLRGLTTIGIVLCFIAVPGVIGVSLGLMQIAMEQVLERVIFVYASMYVQALPSFTYRGDLWASMAFLMDAPGEIPNGVGFVFKNTDFGSQMFELFRGWNGGLNEDREDNIRLTFVTDEDHYWVYVYASFRKRTIRKFHRRMEGLASGEKKGKEHLGLVAGVIFCKAFAIGLDFGLGRFVREQKRGSPFLMVALIEQQNGPPVPIAGVPVIKKWNYKAKAAHEMNPKDDEWGHWIKGPKLKVK